MNREIRFRGLSVNSKEWVYGYFYEECGNTYIIEDRQKESILNRNISKRVDPATVGQFTGLKDKDGKDIFEGDALDTMDGEPPICVSNGGNITRWIVSDCNGEVDSFDESWSGGCVKIIGNIHDNPELLEPKQ